MPEPEPARRRATGGLGPFLLAGAIVLAFLAALVVLVPLADCPRCTKWDFFGPFEKWDIHELQKPCRVCHDKRRVVLLRKWSYRPGEVTK